MATHLTRIRFIIGALTLAFIVACAAPVKAQQRNPDNSVNPTASAVKESQLLNELNRISGRCTIPDQKACTLEQPAGRDWRHFHQVTLRWIGAISILGMLVLLVVFYLIRGMVRIEAGRSGRVLVRFSAFERLVHWMTATCFIILALSGLNITFGRPLLLPLIGPEAFTAWSQWAKYAHNYLSFPVHARRGADLPDVDRLEHSQSRRRRMAQGRRRHCRRHAIRRPAASMPVRR